MPTILRVAGFRFFFYSNERDEPPHVHVERGDAYAKYWLRPITLVAQVGFNPAEIRRLKRIIGLHRNEILESWDAHRRS